MDKDGGNWFFTLTFPSLRGQLKSTLMSTLLLIKCLVMLSNPAFCNIEVCLGFFFGFFYLFCFFIIIIMKYVIMIIYLCIEDFERSKRNLRFYLLFLEKSCLRKWFILFIKLWGFYGYYIVMVNSTYYLV